MRLRARPCRVATLIPAPEPQFVVRWGSSVCSGEGGGCVVAVGRGRGPRMMGAATQPS